MEIAKLRVNGNRCSIVYVRDVTRGLIGATVAIEYTDPVWDTLDKTIVFQAGTVTKDVLSNESVVKVPAEVLDVAGKNLLIGVYGTDADSVLAIPTLWADLGDVKPSADPSGDESTDPTLPVWAQILEQLEELGDVDPDKIAEAVEQYISENPIEGESAYEIALKNGFEGSEQEWLASLEGEKGDPGKSAYQYAQDGGYVGTEEEFAEKLAKEYLPADTPIPAPYVLPPATADTLGGVRVGDGLQMDGELLGVKPDGVYELIETITLEEDAIIDKSKEPDGTPYNFRDIVVCARKPAEINFPEVSAFTSFSDGTNLNTYFQECKLTTEQYQAIEVENRYGTWLFTRNQWALLTAPSNISTNKAISMRKPVNEAVICRWNSIKPFPAGATILIYGVRA